MSETPPAVLTVITGGGFTFETRMLLAQLAGECRFVYLATEFGGCPGEDGLPPGECFPVPSFASFTNRSHSRSARATVATFRTTLAVIRSHRIAAVLVIGCSHAVPMLLAARLLRRPGIYVESITRVDRLSNTGRLVRAFRLAETFITQWPGLQRAVPASRLGTIL